MCARAHYALTHHVAVERIVEVTHIKSRLVEPPFGPLRLEALIVQLHMQCVLRAHKSLILTYRAC
jgi:hypothetical protein